MLVDIVRGTGVNTYIQSVQSLQINKFINIAGDSEVLFIKYNGTSWGTSSLNIDVK